MLPHAAKHCQNQTKHAVINSPPYTCRTISLIRIEMRRYLSWKEPRLHCVSTITAKIDYSEVVP